MGYTELTDEHYKKAKNNGIPKKIAYERYEYLFWDIEKAITEPVKKRKKRNDNMIYAVYKGSRFIYKGTAKECANYLEIKELTFYYYLTPANKRKQAKQKDSGNRLKIVELGVDEDAATEM